MTDTIHPAHPFHLISGFQGFCHTLLLCHSGDDDFHAFVAGLVDLGKVPVQRSDREKICIEDGTMFFQIAATQTPVLADLIVRFFWQSKVWNEVVALLSVCAAICSNIDFI